MKDYNEMSDFEISGYVSMHEHGFSWIEFDDEMASHVKCGNEGSPGFAIVEVKDYCNNPSDAWPIILVNGISVCSPEHCITPNEWAAGRYESFDLYAKRLHHGSKNPLRAAMIVYLMMKDEEK